MLELSKRVKYIMTEKGRQCQQSLLAGPGVKILNKNLQFFLRISESCQQNEDHTPLCFCNVCCLYGNFNQVDRS